METRQTSPFISLIRILSGPILIIVIGVAFFFAYNTYLIDHSLESLRFSVSRVSAAQTVNEAQNLKMLLGEVLLKEVSAEKLDTNNVVNLEFSQNIISEAKINDQLKDLKLILSSVLKDKEANRSAILLKLDALNENIKKAALRAYVGIRGKAKEGVAVRDLSLLEKARNLETNWQIQDAIASYDTFIKTYPDYKDIGWVKLRLAYAHLKVGDLKSAESLFSFVSKEYFGGDEALIAQKFLVRIKEIRKSLKERESLIEEAKLAKTNDEKQKLYYRLGVIDTYNYNLGSARDFFKKAVDIDPQSLLAQKSEFNIGWSLKFQNDLEKSALVFDDVIKVYAKGDIVLNAKYQLADSYHKSGKFEEAIAIYKKIAQDYKDKPIAPLAQFQAGYSYLYNMDDPVQASNTFNTLTSEHQSSALAAYASMDLVPELETRFRDFAFTLLIEGKYDRSKEAFMKAVEVSKKDAWSYAGLGSARFQLNDLKQGFLDIETSVTIVSDEYTHAALGFGFEIEGKLSEAIEEYKKSIAINKDYLIAHYNIGRLYELMARYDDAINEYKEAIRINPDFPQAHGNLAHAYWFKGERALAIDEYKKALALNPKYPEAHYNLGLIFKALKRKEEAKREFEEVLKIAPNFKPAKDHLEQL